MIMGEKQGSNTREKQARDQIETPRSRLHEHPEMCFTDPLGTFQVNQVDTIMLTHPIALTSDWQIPSEYSKGFL